jgi:hypothetical protein
MAVDPQYTSRSGASTVLKIAQTLCRIVGVSAPLIRARFPDRAALLAVLTAAESVCDLLPAAMSEQAAADAADAGTFDPTDATLIPGQDTL